MSIVVEPLRWWHLGEVQKLERELFPHDPWSAESFWQELAQPTRYYVAALADGELVGYAGAIANAPDGDVQTVAVAPQCQGVGVGRALVVDLLQALEMRGVRRALLEVRADNEPARALYESLGFASIARRARYYSDGGDALIMECAIGGAA
jgi:ribosomal-protein-alanine N-acetyltransferase